MKWIIKFMFETTNQHIVNMIHREQHNYRSQGFINYILEDHPSQIVPSGIQFHVIQMDPIRISMGFHGICHAEWIMIIPNRLIFASPVTHHSPTRRFFTRLCDRPMCWNMPIKKYDLGKCRFCRFLMVFVVCMVSGTSFFEDPDISIEHGVYLSIHRDALTYWSL